MRWTWCVVVGVLAGCDSGAPDCTKAVASATASMRLDDPRLVKSLTDACEQGWTGAQRTCIAAAKSSADAARCVPDLAEEIRVQVRADLAKAEAEHAMAEAKLAADKVSAIATQLTALDDKVSQAVTAVVEAQNDADRAAAKAKLSALQREKADLEAQVAAAKAAAARAERMKGVHVSPECLANPLAKGCE